MTKNYALQIVTEAINFCDLSIFSDEQKDKISEALETIAAMRAQLSKPRTNSAATNEKRKAATAQARAELVTKVAPVLRKYLASDITAKDLYEAAKGELPADFTAPKVQNVLLREMKDELIKTETKGKANTYRLK